MHTDKQKRVDTSVDAAGSSACATVDTRSKILTACGALPGETKPLAVAIGIFDVLRAAHARELRDVRARSGAARLLVLVTPGQDTMLSLSVRIELVAALEAVDHVCAGGPAELTAVLAKLHPVCVLDLRDLDARLSRELRARVLGSRA